MTSPLTEAEADGAMPSATPAGADASPDAAGTVRVWDPLVRLFHWSLVGGFALAYATADEVQQVHEIAGYAIAALLALRIVWGFVGPQHARFADFVRPPGEVLRFLADSLRLKARRHLGHNPAGGAMVLALIAAIAGICATGYMMETPAYRDARWLEDVHEVLANGTLALIFLHVAGVLLASFEHKENLVAAMFTGRKRA